MSANINWNEVNWNKDNTEIAKRYGVSVSTVNYHRSCHGGRHLARQSWKLDFSNVDWSRSNRFIAESMSCSLQSVRSARRKYEQSLITPERKPWLVRAWSAVITHLFGPREVTP